MSLHNERHINRNIDLDFRVDRLGNTLGSVRKDEMRELHPTHGRSDLLSALFTAAQAAVAPTLADYGITQEMLDMAAAKGLYRNRILGNLLEPLQLADGTYGGVIDFEMT